jgi:hypothetical protein
MSEIHVYDFDSTLFRSPHAPSSWQGDWWSDPMSLLPPCVPEVPSKDWWNTPVVNQARASVANPEVYAVLMTGRKDKSAFRYRVPELLRQVGLRFDSVHLVGGQLPDGTLHGKIKVLAGILKRYPFITKMVVYDDRPTHLKAFNVLAARHGIEVETHLVRALSMEPLCGEGDVRTGKPPKEFKYLGVFLDARSKAALSRAFPFMHENIQNDHITLVKGASSRYTSLVGLRVEAKVVGYVDDDKGQAVVVDLPRGLPYAGDSRPHVTLSHADGVGPSYSNTLIRNGEILSAPRLLLTGVVDGFPRTLQNGI